MTTVKVKFRVSESDAATGTVYYQIIHNRVTRRIATDYHVCCAEWDARRSTVTTTEESGRKNIILSVRDKIRCDVRRLGRIIGKLEETALDYTADDVADSFREYSRQYSFFNCMEEAISRLLRMGKTGTAKNYRAALNSFRKFRNEEDLMLDCLTGTVMEEYQAWQTDRGVVPNTISFYARIYRAVYRRAVEDDIIVDRHPFRRIYTGVGKTVKRALSQDTLRKVKAVDLSLDPKLDLARDMFLLSFYFRGMSFIDLAFLRKSDLAGGSLTYRRRKTGQTLTISWTEEMQRILDKYPANESDYLLPIIRKKGVNARCACKYMCHRLNRHIKQVGRIIGAEDYKDWSFYRSRHSWASLARARGISLSVISEGMGHDSEATTQIYLASLDTSAVDRANDIIISSI